MARPLRIEFAGAIYHVLGEFGASEIKPVRFLRVNRSGLGVSRLHWGKGKCRRESPRPATGRLHHRRRSSLCRIANMLLRYDADFRETECRATGVHAAGASRCRRAGPPPRRGAGGAAQRAPDAYRGEVGVNASLITIHYSDPFERSSGRGDCQERSSGRGDCQ